MQGKPYKDKFNGQRLSKMDYAMKYVSMSEKIHLNFPGMSIGDDGSLISTNKLKLSKKKRIELRKKFENLQKSNPDKYKDFNAYQNSLNPQSLNFLAPPSHHRKQRNTPSIKDGATSEDTISVLVPSPRDSQYIKFPQIKEHVPNSSKMLENINPSRISKRMILESISKTNSAIISGEQTQIDSEDYTSESFNRLKFYKSKRKYTKNIHDKFNTAIRLDQNWGVSSKVATDIIVDIKRKSNNINYRKFRTHTKTPSDLGSQSQMRNRIPKHNNVVGTSVGLPKNETNLSFVERINNSMRNNQINESFSDKKSKSYLNLSVFQKRASYQGNGAHTKSISKLNNPYANLMKSQQITPTKNKHFSSTNADVQMINEIKRNPTAYKKYNRGCSVQTKRRDRSMKHSINVTQNKCSFIDVDPNIPQSNKSSK